MPREKRAVKARASLSTHRPGSGQVRIVGGTWKRTPIGVADVAGLRPTPDRVRETLFNWLVFLRPDLGALRGLDLFAGTGALGFELASRGGRNVVMVERDPRLVANLTALKQRLDARQVEIFAGDALEVARRLAAGAFDIIFLDPPFDGGLLLPALECVRPLLARDGLIYAESREAIDRAQAGNLGLEIVRAGKAGRVWFYLLRRDGS